MGADTARSPSPRKPRTTIWTPASQTGEHVQRHCRHVSRQYGLKTPVLSTHLDAGFEGKDWTALSIGQELPDGRIQITGATWPKHVEVCEQDVVSMCRVFKVSKFTEERNGDKGIASRPSQTAFQEGRPPHHHTQGRKGNLGYQETQNKHVKITSFLLAHWPNLVWNSECQEDYKTLVTNHREGEEPDDPPDSLASYSGSSSTSGRAKKAQIAYLV